MWYEVVTLWLRRNYNNVTRQEASFSIKMGVLTTCKHAGNIEVTILRCNQFD
jgi:hypothetical protein